MVHRPLVGRGPRGVRHAVLVGEDRDQPAVAGIEVEVALGGVVEVRLLEDERHAEQPLPEVDRRLPVGADEGDVVDALALELAHYSTAFSAAEAIRKPIGRSCSSARCASRLAVRARIGIAFTDVGGKPRSSITAAIGIDTFMVSGLSQTCATASRYARASSTWPALTPCSSASSRIRSARGSSGLWTGCPNPGSRSPASLARRAF